MKEDNTSRGYKVIREESKGNRVYRMIMIIALTVFITFIATTIGMYTYFAKHNDEVLSLKTLISEEDDAESIAETLTEYRKLIDKYYLSDVDESKLKEGAIRGYIEGLDDQYTEYISKSEMEEYKEDLSGEFVGIGIYMIQDNDIGKVRVLAPIKGGPAEKAGVLAGDIIKSLNGVEYSADQFNEVADNMKGEEGSEVTLEVVRNEQTLSFNIKRENVKVNPVESEVIEDNIGYITFSSFDKTTAEDFKAKYEELKEKNIQSLIIDIRNNGGGIVDQAEQIAGYILDKGSTILYEVNKDKEEEEVKTEEDPIINIPVVLLVNENSASASEILASALKDYEKAKIVGTTTYGKGIIQLLLSLPDGSGLKITSEEYLTPKKNKINKVGVEPNEVVKLPDDIENKLIVERDKDTQLQKAIELLK